MNVFITGITGMAGSHLADFLLHLPEVKNIYGLIRWRSPRDNISHLYGKVRLILGDLTDYASVEKALVEVMGNTVTIFHLAAQSYVPYSWKAPKATLDANAIGTTNLLEAVKVIIPWASVHICSSSEVYGDTKITPITTAFPMKPRSPYGASKAAADLMAQAYHDEYGIHTVITRAFTHTGPRRGPVFVASWFAKQLAEISRGMAEEDVIHVGNLESVRTWCDVRDMVRAYWLAMEYCEAGSIWNVGGDETFTIEEMLRKLCWIAGICPEIVIDPELVRHADVTNQVPDVEPFRRATGWKPAFKLERTLADLYDYWHDRLGREQSA